MRVKLEDLLLVVETAKGDKQDVATVEVGESKAFENTLDLVWTDQAGREVRCRVFRAGTATPEISRTAKLYRRGK